LGIMLKGEAIAGGVPEHFNVTWFCGEAQTCDRKTGDSGTKNQATKANNDLGQGKGRNVAHTGESSTAIERDDGPPIDYSGWREERIKSRRTETLGP
jgi:hypothetical protein